MIAYLTTLFRLEICAHCRGESVQNGTLSNSKGPMTWKGGQSCPGRCEAARLHFIRHSTFRVDRGRERRPRSAIDLPVANYFELGHVDFFAPTVWSEKSTPGPARCAESVEPGA